MRMRKYFLAGLLILFVAMSVEVAPLWAAERNPKWAEPVAAEGVPNLYRIAPGLYRSAQPSAEGMRSLEKMGIKTVVNLRNFNSDDKELKGTTLKGVSISMNTWDVDVEEIVEVLKILRDPSGAPYLIHCQHGADRTGTMSAMYRIVLQGWSKRDAIEEMTEGGYGYHSIWGNLIELIEEVDVEEVRERMNASE